MTEKGPRLRGRPAERVPAMIAGLLYLGFALQLLHLIWPRAGVSRALMAFYSTLVVDLQGASIALGVFLVILGVALDRRKRVAWVILVGLLGLQALINLAVVASLLVLETRRGDLRMLAESAASLLSTLLLLAVLWLARDQFNARSPRGNLIKAVATLLGGVAITALVGAVLVMVVPADTHRRVPRLEWLLQRLIYADAPQLGMPHWVITLLGVMQAVALLAAVWVLLRSQRDALDHGPADEALVRALVAESPEDSLAYFATRRDKAWCFAPDGGAAVAYRVVLGTCLAASDPIGPRHRWPEAIRAWSGLAREYGWTPAVIGASEAGAQAYADHAGLRVLRLGDEAVLEARGFTLEGPEMKPVRHAVQRLQRLGYSVRIRRHDAIPAAEMAELIALTERWRDTETERGYSMALGRLGDPLDGGCLMVEAHFPEGEARDGSPVAALLSFVPWGRDGYSLDVMRRSPRADNGVNELMVTELLRSGIRRLSLNFAVFRSVFEEGAQLGAGPGVRLWRRLLVVASRWWQIESLYRSNMKYQPSWSPRFLCYEEPGDIALVGVASGVAEGFLDLPGFLRGSRPESAPPTAEQVAAVMPRTEPRIPVLPEQMRVRLDKRAALLAAGVDPYPPDFVPSGPVAAAAGVCTLAGRVVALRDHGGVVFADLRDGSGRLQLLFSADAVADLDRFVRIVDLGDHLGVHGRMGTSRNGTPSLLVDRWRVTAKAVRPLPDKRRGLQDPESRVRLRYLDLAVGEDAARRLRQRSAIIGAVRETLLGQGYLEVDTPTLQAVHGGANARPFRTHSNAYDLDLYLRIAPELYLKRLLVGGIDRIFEIGRNFRNEGADNTHNPEFTMVEAYRAYADYTVMRRLTQDLVTNAVRAATGGTIVAGRDQHGARHRIDLAEDWPVITVHEAVSAACGSEVTADTDRAELIGIAEGLGIAVDARWTRGAVLLELYEHLVEDRTVRPTFYTDFPAEVSPLTRPHRVDDRLAERWDLVAFGAEIGTAYTEMADPVVQRQRLTEQSLLAAGGDPEAMELDEDFLVALEHGMPPAGGLGVGLDRLVMLVTETSIRDAITFPLVRPRRD